MKKLLTIFAAALGLSASAFSQERDSTSMELPDDQVYVMDTLDTQDKYLKIIIYSDHTWQYHDEGRPVIDTSNFFLGWTEDGEIHAFKNVNISELPEEIDLKLVDENNPYCLPYQASVRSGYRFRRSRPHNGVDLSLHTGDTIRAAFNGVVRFSSGGAATGGYGNLVVIRHTNGLETYYGHLSRRLVEADEPVKAGEVIGLGGSTGRSTGPHLHFETRYMGQSFDPERVFDFESGALRDTVLSLKKHYFSIYSHYGQTDSESKAAAGRIIHKVKQGDNLGAIARKYGTTVSAICRLNNISSKKILRIGERLIVR